MVAAAGGQKAIMGRGKHPVCDQFRRGVVRLPGCFVLASEWRGFTAAPHFLNLIKRRFEARMPPYGRKGDLQSSPSHGEDTGKSGKGIAVTTWHQKEADRTVSLVNLIICQPI
jgi:hypothetical protein